MKQVFESKWTEKVRSIKLNRLQQEEEGGRRAWYLEPAYFFHETMRQLFWRDLYFVERKEAVDNLSYAS